VSAEVELVSSDDPAFLALRTEIQGTPRQHGYYLVDRVSIRGLQDLEPDALLERVFRHFDDAEWAPDDQRPTDQTWLDYATTAEGARSAAIDALVGGSEIGHARDTIPPAQAAALWEHFEALFPPPRAYYVGMGFGDARYVFQRGAAIVSAEFAGLVWVVESD